MVNDLNYYIRKRVRFPKNRWSYVSLGRTFETIDEAVNSRALWDWISIWGMGVYEVHNPTEGVVERVRIKNTDMDFRSRANRNGKPVKPSILRNSSTHIRKSECPDCSRQGFLRGLTSGKKQGLEKAEKMYSKGHRDGFFQAIKEIQDGYIDILESPSASYRRPQPPLQDLEQPVAIPPVFRFPISNFQTKPIKVYTKPIEK